MKLFKPIKKLMAPLLIALLLLSACTSEGAEDTTTASPTEADSSQSQTTAAQDIVPKCTAAISYCVEDRSLLYSKQGNMKIYPASLTKLLTAYVALQYVSPDAEFTVGSELDYVEKGSSLCLIKKNNILKLSDLLAGLLLVSGNDAAYTIAVGTARRADPKHNMSDAQAIKYFCGLMNDTAEKMGMVNSRFVNPDGWDNDDQYSTPTDLLILTENALKNETIRTILGEKERKVTFVAGGSITWKNHIKLIDSSSEYYCADFIGGKTGTTDGAGYSLIAAFERDGKTYITVVAGCKNDNERCSQTLELYTKTAPSLAVNQ